MAFNETSAILHSIEEELAKLALEVDMVESKLLMRKNSVSIGGCPCMYDPAFGFWMVCSEFALCSDVDWKDHVFDCLWLLCG